ncbi:N4-gp56 family major capsid protein [Maridesulfovibrio ferrireducens]|uniref:N4-gp56 family major capsid protein n=1 Tax=Maridesulfovibrio ferrireducens TaxID=246191 RepID=UPI001A1C8DD3|nr:N4-gp56 family major capsid protein [Maridesulfovibrio ferrireducens]MBI9110323.1 N4-gp56 family major capsid protein [Maridesulfovibrio ferrireducens]
MGLTKFGDIGPRTAGFSVPGFLKRAAHFNIFGMFGQSLKMPKNKGQVVKWRRYNALAPATVPIVEGVTPAGKKLSKTDVTASLKQYGDYIELTDVIEDTHEDPVLSESMEILGEQAGVTLDMVLEGILRAGTNVIYSGGTSRATVTKPITKGMQRLATRALKKQRAGKVTKVLSSTVHYGTKPVAASYIAITHSDCESDIRDLPGFVPVEEYGQLSPYENEIGKVEDTRYVVSTSIEPIVDGGGAKGASGAEMLSESGTNADVYPIYIIGANAYGDVALKGKESIVPKVVNPSTPSKSDKLGQRGHVGWITYYSGAILNDAWMVRLEVAVTETPSDS